MVIAGSREDMCNKCFVFANRHKYGSPQSSRLAMADGEEDDDIVLQDNDVEDEDQAAADMYNNERLVQAAARHVNMAQKQRLLYHQKKKEAIESIQQGTTANRVLCDVADYAQNMYVPNFASEQPGATYYYSPMNAYCFGIVDASIDRLTGWIYMEDQGKKGGNNVASLLMHHLQYKGIVAKSAVEPFKELNLVMDNCGGQNKNRHVLRLLHLMVKTGIAKVARAIFLAHGHTKNDCSSIQ